MEIDIVIRFVLLALLLITAASLLYAGTMHFYKNDEIKRLESIINNEQQKYTKLQNSEISVKDSSDTLKFLNDLLDIKFGYYLNAYMLAYFVNDKELEKKEIIKLKTDFYSDVSKSLNNYQKNQILKVFSKEGVELYIHQSFLRLLNDANIKFKTSGNGGIDALSSSALKAIYKG